MSPALPRPEMWWSPEQQGIEHQKPQRGDGNDECGQARRDGEFRVRQREVAAHQEQQAYDCGQRNLLGRVENLPPGGGADGQHDRARDRKAHAAHQSGRNGLDGDIDAEIGRAPEQVHESEGKNHHPPAWALSGIHCREEQGEAKRYQTSAEARWILNLRLLATGMASRRKQRGLKSLANRLHLILRGATCN